MESCWPPNRIYIPSHYYIRFNLTGRAQRRFTADGLLCEEYHTDEEQALGTFGSAVRGGPECTMLKPLQNC